MRMAVAGLYLAVHQTDIDDDAPVAVIVAVEDQRPQRFTAGIQRAGNIGDDPLQHFLHIEAGLGRDPGSIQRRDTDDIFDLMGNPLRIGGGKVDLVDDRHDLQVVFQCQIGIGKVWASMPWEASTTSTAPSQAASDRDTS